MNKTQEQVVNFFKGLKDFRPIFSAFINRLIFGLKTLAATCIIIVPFILVMFATVIIIISDTVTLFHYQLTKKFGDFLEDNTDYFILKVNKFVKL